MTVVALCLWLLPLTGTAADQVASGQTAVETAARELVRNEVDAGQIAEMRGQFAQTMANKWAASLRAKLKRDLTDSEKTRLASFWLEKLEQVLSYERVQGLLAPVISKQLTTTEINDINLFYKTLAGRRLLSVRSAILEAAGSVGQDWSQKLADPKWLTSATEELKREIPSLFVSVDGAK